MSYWIDRAVLWLFTAAASFFLMLVLTDRKIILSLFFAFLIVCALRMLVRLLPEKRWVRRSERLHYANQLLKKWALMSAQEALHSIRQVLPDLLNSEDWQKVLLVQRMPCAQPMDVNSVLSLWRTHINQSELILLVTGPVDTDAASLLPELSQPTVRLVDSKILLRRLLPTIRSIPAAELKKERYAPLSARIAQFLKNIRPVRASLYSLLFLAVYLPTHSWVYLAASALLVLLPLLCLLEKAREKKRSTF